MSTRGSSYSVVRSMVLVFGAAAFLGGCSGEEPKATVKNTTKAVSSCAQATHTLLSADFSQGMDGWRHSSSKPTQPDHNWTLTEGEGGKKQLQSDPIGQTVAGGYYNRLDSPWFNPEGRKNMRLRIRTKYSVAPHGIFQIFVANHQGNNYKRSLIGEFGGQNPSWPALDEFTLPITDVFSIETGLYISLTLNSANGGDFGAIIQDLEVIADETANVPKGEVFGDDFAKGLANWSVYSSPEVQGHMWAAVDAGNGCPGAMIARSDPAGQTIPNNYTRLESGPIDLTGKSSGKIVIKTSYSLPQDGSYQVYVADMDSDVRRSLVAELRGKNDAYPQAEEKSFPIPADFLGRPRIRVAFLELTGNAPADYGIALEKVSVQAE